MGVEVADHHSALRDRKRRVQGGTADLGHCSKLKQERDKLDFEYSTTDKIYIVFVVLKENKTQMN